MVRDASGKLLLVNKVGIRTDIREISGTGSSGPTKLVFIGFDTGKEETAVRKRLDEI
jgi:hypothetical protein